MSTSKLIDCFPYFNEKELLEFRIKLLYDKVEKFIITEANQTHSGLNKTYNATKVLQNIDDPLNKIKLIQVDYSKYDNVFGNYERENLQRDVVLEVLDQFDDECLFFFGDCDEILNPEYIEWICNTARNMPNSILRTPLAFLNCRADLRVFDGNDNPIDWNSPFVANKKHLTTYKPSKIREFKSLPSPEDRNIFQDVSITVDDIEFIMGWHFSWMGNNQNRMIKYKSYLHSNDFDINFLEKFMHSYKPQNGSLDPLGRNDHILRPYDIELLPDLILRNEKFKNFFLPELAEEKVSPQKNYETIIDFLVDNPEISTDKNCVKYFNESYEWDFMQYHSYIENFYNEEFKKYKNKNISLCEIGIDTGGSIAIWSNYFNDSNIIGIDVKTSRLKPEYYDNNFHNVSYIIDNAYDKNLVDSLPNFDIIIDDGPHTFESQIEFIQLYLEKLNNGGIMVIEDVKSISHINQFEKLIGPGFITQCINLSRVDNLSDSILYIIKK